MSNLRKVLITGANRGLGYKLAEVLLPKYHILLTSRNICAANEAKKKLENLIPGASITT